MLRISVLIFLLCTAFFCCTAQVVVMQADSVIEDKKPVPQIEVDSTIPYDPRIAIRRSAMVPGWGQYTNKKYWKIPIVYGALGTTGFIFFRNLRQYNESKEAFRLASDNDPNNDFMIKEPYFTVKDQPQRIKSFRDQVRQNVDYSVLFFIGFWALNVADAAVDAHLKTFDVSDDLSLNIKAGYSPLAQTAGVQIALQIGK